MYRNSEGYVSPTEGAAFHNILREEKREVRAMTKALLKEITAARKQTDGDDDTCFAFSPEEEQKRFTGECKATNQLRCPGCESCPFYKSRNKLLEDRMAADERLRNLPFGTQKHISEKYYQGQMPWRDCDESEKGGLS